LTTTAFTTVVWLAVTFMTRPEPREHLREFYRQVRPAGPGWKAIARECGIQPAGGEIFANIVNTVLGVVLVYSALFATGAVCLNEISLLTWFAPALLFSGGLLAWRLSRGK
jgi:hypothetical protein